ncbi:MAG: glycosyltransferase family 4 protein [Lachnospiraceae bacterium]|nr:glycosyltransferase family 4 protein [Lachnospiraceae bacterium]
MTNKKLKVLMCGSKLSVGGGMVTVIKNYLNCKDWNDIEITYIPTHIDKSNIVKAGFYCIAYIRIFFLTVFRHYDLAHIHTTENGSFFRKGYLAKLLKRRKIKVILHHHIDYTEFYLRQSEKNKQFINHIFNEVDLNIVLGKNQGEFIKDKAANANIRVVYNAVNTYAINPYNVNATYVMFFGWLIERKGIFDFLRAIRELDAVLDENIKFILCGEGEPSIYDKIKDLGINNRIAHIGWVNREERDKYFKNTFVHVLPSYREGLPMTILESMAYGIPNIATNIATIPEVIQSEKNGILIRAGDIEALKSSIYCLSKDKKLRRKLSENAFKTIASKFSLSEHLDCVRKIYKNISEEGNKF